MIDYNKYDKAILVTGDGDFACLVDYLNNQEKLKILLIPDENNYSCLLKKPAKSKIAFVNRLKNKIEYKKELH